MRINFLHGLVIFTIIFFLNACSSIIPCPTSVRPSQITQEGRIFKGAQKHKKEYIRRACGTSELIDTKNENKGISFEFIELSRYEEAEKSLDWLKSSSYLYQRGGAEYLFKRYKGYENQIKSLEGQGGIGRQCTKINRIRQYKNSLNEIRSYLDPDFTEEQLMEHQRLTYIWVEAAIKNLLSANLIWSDYPALVYIDREWLHHQIHWCADWRPAYYKHSYFSKNTKNNLVTHEGEILEKLQELIEEKIYQLLLKNKLKIISEINKIYTDEGLMKFHFKYLGGSSISRNAMDRSGIRDIYKRRVKEFLGNKKEILPKYRN